METEQRAIYQGYTYWEYFIVSTHSFSGSMAAKSLHLLKCLQVACISKRKFHHHQAKYPAPSIIHVWKHSQQALLSEAIVIGADGRADSLGRSAKFGSYGIIDMSSNKVFHI